MGEGIGFGMYKSVAFVHVLVAWGVARCGLGGVGGCRNTP
jgi:hypothetical protein